MFIKSKLFLLLYKFASSFFYLKKIGYYYIKSPNSVTKQSLDSQFIKAIFTHLRVVFELSKNNRYEKDMFNDIFNRICIKNNVTDLISQINTESDFEFYMKTLNKFINNEFININNKNYILKLKNIL